MLMINNLSVDCINYRPITLNLVIISSSSSNRGRSSDRVIHGSLSLCLAITGICGPTHLYIGSDVVARLADRPRTIVVILF